MDSRKRMKREEMQSGTRISTSGEDTADNLQQELDKRHHDKIREGLIDIDVTRISFTFTLKGSRWCVIKTGWKILKSALIPGRKFTIVEVLSKNIKRGN